MNLCHPHSDLDSRNALECEVGNNCVACSLNERTELLRILAPCAPENKSRDSVTVLREVVEFWNTHKGNNRVVVSYPAESQNCEHGIAWNMECLSCGPSDFTNAESQSGERVCVKCGHNNVNSKGECRQCVDWQKHECEFAAGEKE